MEIVFGLTFQKTGCPKYRGTFVSEVVIKGLNYQARIVALSHQAVFSLFFNSTVIGKCTLGILNIAVAVSIKSNIVGEYGGCSRSSFNFDSELNGVQPLGNINVYFSSADSYFLGACFGNISEVDN
jgi:hypothetical protein